MKPTTLLAFLAVAAALLSALPASAAGGAKGPLAGRKRPADAGPTVITSDQLEFDYQSFVALFDGHVVVKDPEFTLKTDRMLVTFENSNDVKRVDCIGNVDMVSDDIHAVCGRAVYTRDNALVVMSDEPVVMKGPDQRVAGQVINIWLDDERVEVKNGAAVEAKPNSFKKPAGDGTKGAEPPKADSTKPQDKDKGKGDAK